MRIEFRDFLDKPYKAGCHTSQSIVASSTLQTRVSYIALTTLLWTPIINIVVYLTLKKKLTAIASYRRLQERASPILIMGNFEKDKYPLSPTYDARESGRVDITTREAILGSDFSRIALLNVIGNRGETQVFDLREISTDPFTQTTIYCPFEISLGVDSDETFISATNLGWLALTTHSESIEISRIDNFKKSFRLGSAMIQFAIEISISKGFDGRVTLYSSGGSAGFYYRLGFKCEDPDQQRRVEAEFKSGNRGLDGGPMYLPPESIAIWKQKITQASILD